MAKDKVPENEQVDRILGSFEDDLVADWADTESETLAAKTFLDFTKIFRERWLPCNWQQTVRMEMLGSRLDPEKETFEAWATKIQSLNTMLRNSESHLADDMLRVQMEILLDDDLQRLVKRATGLGTLREWIFAVKELDDERQISNRRQDKRMAPFLLENTIRKRPNLGPRSVTPSSSYTSNNTAVTPSGRDQFPPPLTKNERELLREHKGCNHCRKFYVNHTFATCNNTPPVFKGYKERTLEDAWASLSAMQ